MAAPSRRVAKAVKWGSVPVALGVSALLVWQASFAAFSDTTTNPANNWATGTVVLTDNLGTATFAADNLKPGSTGTRCVVVSSTGTLPSAVKLYGAKPTGTGLAPSLKLTVTPGAGGDAGCTGFTADTGGAIFDKTLDQFTAANYGTGLGSWNTAGTASAATPGAESRTYQFTYTVDALAGNAVQGTTAGIDFVWEAQNI